MTSLFVFPALAPSEHPTVLAGKFPHVEKRSTGGRIYRIGLSNAQIAGEITLSYRNIDTPQLLTLFAHWLQVRGTTLSFSLPEDLFPSMNVSARSRLLATAWRHKEKPKVIDICAGVSNQLLHSLEFVIIAQPRRVVSPVLVSNPSLSLPVLPNTAPGAKFGVSVAWTAGSAGLDVVNVPGARW
jgi:hypothetical protein